MPSLLQLLLHSQVADDDQQRVRQLQWAWMEAQQPFLWSGADGSVGFCVWRLVEVLLLSSLVVVFNVVFW